MIRIFLGKLGSGKTLSASREIINDGSGMTTYSNIDINKSVKNHVKIDESSIIKTEEDDKGKQKFSLNWDFWQKKKKPLSICWDEIHLSANSRASMTKKNNIIVQFIAMGRRITGMDKRGYGKLTFIAQTEFSVEKYIRHLANEFRYHTMHYVQHCNDCNLGSWKTSEDIDNMQCLFCSSYDTERKHFRLKVEQYIGLTNYIMNNKSASWWVGDIEKYFGTYDTHQEIRVNNAT